VGTGFALHAISLQHDADGMCPGKVCSPDGMARINDAKTFANLATVGFGVGVAGVALGTWLVLRSHGSSSAQAQLAPLVGADRAGVALSGAW
jgi:hypothetical protein